MERFDGRNAPDQSFQSRVAPWMQECFGSEISADRLERGDRLIEEVFELLQSGDYPRERVRALEDYVWSRSPGDPAQEVGGVMVTLAAYCLAHELDMHTAAETELIRIWGKVEAIRAKQAGKPTGSALPVPQTAPTKEFEPCVVRNDAAGFCELVLKDTATVWSACKQEVEIGRDMETKEVVAVRIHDAPDPRDALNSELVDTLEALKELVELEAWWSDPDDERYLIAKKVEGALHAARDGEVTP